MRYRAHIYGAGAPREQVKGNGITDKLLCMYIACTYTKVQKQNRTVLTTIWL